ncbi:MAG: HNH endonuclease [Bacteroidales bacterium]|nr:HNH endonuclease [Bacteroidales bacterium]
MKEIKYNCFICGKQIESDNVTVEHIILNGIGGKLRSKNLICKKCNNELGSSSDVALSESLSFYTDMLMVKKDRDHGHNQVMTDEDGHEIIVEEAGNKLKLRRSYIDKEIIGDEKRYHIVVKNKDELRKYLARQVKAGEITQEQMNEVMSKAQVTKQRSKLNIQTRVPEEAFPSIVKSAVDYYIECFHRNEDIKHLIPYLKGEKDCKEILNLVIFDQSPFTENPNEITHMIHLEGSAKTGVLYALMEYYSIYTYVVFLKEDYSGADVNITYCYDVINNVEVKRDFSLPVDRAWIVNYMKNFENSRKELFAKTENRANKILGICQERGREKLVSDIVNKAFAKHPEGCLITPTIYDQLVNDIVGGLEEYLID